jgi:hypothetical protein
MEGGGLMRCCVSNNYNKRVHKVRVITQLTQKRLTKEMKVRFALKIKAEKTWGQF